MLHICNWWHFKNLFKFVFYLLVSENDGKDFTNSWCLNIMHFLLILFLFYFSDAIMTSTGMEYTGMGPLGPPPTGSSGQPGTFPRGAKKQQCKFLWVLWNFLWIFEFSCFSWTLFEFPWNIFLNSFEFKWVFLSFFFPLSYTGSNKVFPIPLSFLSSFELSWVTMTFLYVLWVLKFTMSFLQLFWVPWVFFISIHFLKFLWVPMRFQNFIKFQLEFMSSTSFLSILSIFQLAYNLWSLPLL